MIERKCDTCRHWWPPDLSDGARSPHHGRCNVIDTCDLTKETVPAEAPAFIDDIDGSLATLPTFSCSMWEYRWGDP